MFVAIAIISSIGFLTAFDILKHWNNIDDGERSQAGINLVQTVATITGGIAIFWNIILSRKQLAASLDQNITNRFEQAVGYLGSENVTVRVGAIYAFERIARDSLKDHWTVMEVLMSFITEKCGHGNIADQDSKSDFPRDAQAAILVVGRRKMEFDHLGAIIRLNKVQLSGAIFSYLNFSNAHFIWSDLSGANFFMVDLKGANFYRAKLNKTVFYKASLCDAELIESDLRGADFRECDLTRAKLNRANLREAKGLSVEQVKLAHGWQEAFYDDDFRNQLGLNISS
ncbi:MAG: pentapeptide repeat-containing protein [Leptolyngbya sp. SIO1E4]|nr:pentapeptide repeat-containing protein [Leptolyngbya sp. SIO1E4]